MNIADSRTLICAPTHGRKETVNLSHLPAKQAIPGKRFLLYLYPTRPAKGKVSTK
jgi:hypothetical protein